MLISNTKENEDIVKNFVKALNECKFEKAAELVHNDFEFMKEWNEYVEFYSDFAPEALEIDNGKTGWLNRHKYNAKHLQSLQRIILKILSNNNDVWIWSKRKGIHSSDFDGFPASNKELDIYSFVMIILYAHFLILLDNEYFTFSNPISDVAITFPFLFNTKKVPSK